MLHQHLHDLRAQVLWIHKTLKSFRACVRDGDPDFFRANLEALVAASAPDHPLIKEALEVSDNVDIPYAETNKLLGLVTPEMMKAVIEDGAVRSNKGKTEISQLPPAAVRAIATVMMMGEEKYGKHNWRKGLSYTSVCDSLLRHVFAFLDGEDLDPESGLNHMAHAATNAAFLLQYISDGKEGLDDRYDRQEV